MKRIAFSRAYWLAALLLAALLPAVGCIRPHRTASNSSTGSNGTGSYGSNFTGRNGNSTQSSNSTFPSRRGSSSSSDPNITVKEPLVVAQAGGVDAAEADTVAEKPAPKADPRDWPYWRGPEYNGISRETGLIDDFDLEAEEGGNVSWRREDLGGRCTPVVMNGRLYILVRAEPESAREGEKVVCVDIETGETLWENRFNVWLSDVPDTRVGWSSVVGDPETGNVYALGVCGFFQCLNGETGERIWSVPMHEKFGLLSTYGGRTNFPIIHEDLVIISAIVIGWGDMAKPAHRFIGFDKLSGEVVWFDGTTPLPYDTTYSAPTMAVFNGQKALVFGSGDGRVWAIQPRTGQPIWNYRFSRRGLNVSPIVAGNMVFSGHSEENLIREGAATMGSVVAINGLSKGNANETGELWRIDEMMVGKSSPLVIGDHLYCADDRAKLFVLDTKTGEQLTRKALGTVMRASLLYADGKIYAITAGSSRWYILEPDGEGGVDIVSRGYFPEGEEVNASPICSHGKIFVQSSGALYCLEDKSKEPGIEPRPDMPAEAPVAEDEKPAHVQIVPAELLMQPGRIETFKARLFNSAGQLLGEAEDAEFSIEGAGEITGDGTFLAPSDPIHAATIVRAKLGDITGRARVRIVPPLPWTYTFDDLDAPPVTWVGARYRHVVREVDGSKAMVKITTIPKGTRSRCWFGHPELSEYTIQADVRGAITNEKMPDIGLIAQGYTLDLQGANQKFEIRTWVTQRRMAKAIDFAWKPDTWYTMKLQATLVDDESTPTGKKAVLRGKIWPRGDEEPAEWTIEATDTSPNLSGSPGLFGNAKDAELYLDNITVTDNDASAE